MYEDDITLKDLTNDASYNVRNLSYTVNGDVKMYFLELYISDNNNVYDRNVYWLSYKMDELDWEDTTFYETKCKKYADFTQINDLDSITLVIDNTTTIITNEDTNDQYYLTVVDILNPSNSNIVAFFIYPNIVLESNNDIITPIYWTDNFLILFPGQSQQVNATYNVNTVPQNDNPLLIVDVFNNIS